MYWNTLLDFVKSKEIIIDRKKGAIHPKYKNMVYPLDYGYLKTTTAMDGNGIDIFWGSLTSNLIQGILCTIDKIKNDSEIKILYNCSDIEISIVLEFMNSNFMDAIFIQNTNNFNNALEPEDYRKYEEAIKLAIEEAFIGRKNGEDPFGAVLLNNKFEICSSTHSKCIEFSDPTAHAELLLIRDYCKKINQVYLKNYSIICSAEPCIMCSGAIKWAKIERVVYSVPQYYIQKTSGGKIQPSCNSLLNSGMNNIEIIGGVLLNEGLKVFKDFNFKKKDIKEFQLTTASS